MKLKQFAGAFMLCLISMACHSQTAEDFISMSSETPDPLIQKNFPAFYSIYNYEKLKDKEIKGVYFGDFGNSPSRGPAFNLSGYIFIDQTLMLKNSSNYGNVVLWRFYQSVGSIHYQNEHPKMDSLSFLRSKFTFALIKAKTLAENGNCGVLQVAVNNFKHLNSNSLDKYPKQIVKEITDDPAYQGYVLYAGNCSAAQSTNTGLNLEPIKQDISNQNTKISLDENAISAILSEFRKTYDDMTGMNSYYDHDSPKKEDNDVVMLYINRFKDGTFELRLRVQVYTQYYFKMLPKCLIQTNNNTYPINAPQSAQVFGQQESWGHFDIPATTYIINVMTEITSSSNPKIRYYGVADKEDNRYIKQKEIDALKSVLSAYKKLIADK